MDAKPLSTWLSELEQLHPSAIDLGLARCGEVARRLGLLSSSATTITVAGTNGKGSTVAVMEALLCEQGVSCGAFTSPHLIKYNERIRVNGVEVGDEIIVRAFETIDAARGDISLTYFEFGACLVSERRTARNAPMFLRVYGANARNATPCCTARIWNATPKYVQSAIIICVSLRGVG